MFILIVCAVGILSFFYHQEKKGRESLKALEYWLNAGRMFEELIDDPSMTSEKWKMAAEVFDHADRWFLKTHPYMKDISRYGELARRKGNDLLGDIVGVS